MSASLGRAGLLIFGVLTLTNCALRRPNPEHLISTALVMNSVKCGFAVALLKEKDLPVDYRRLKGNVATFQLQLKVAYTRSFSASVGATGTGIVPWQGASLLPSFSHSNSQAWTVDTIINASYKLNAENDAVCEAAGVTMKNGKYYDPFGFSVWLSDLLVDLSKVSLEQPSGRLEKLTYDATFGVTKITEVKSGLKLSYLDANASGKIDRIDTQHITIVISGAPSTPATPKKSNQAPPPPKTDLGPTAVAPDLSSIAPSID